MSQLGRISGPLLDANLNRIGVDLTFRNYGADDDLLYLDVNNNRIGINKQPANRRVEIDGTTHSPNLISTTSADIATITAATNTFSTDISSTIIVRPNQVNPLVTFDNMRAGDLDFKDNTISNYAVNGSIELNPNGTGIVDIYANTTVNGNVTVTGNTRIDGNLTEASNIIVGDSILDTVVIAPDFTQSIIPGDHLTYDLGTALKRWSQIHVHQNSNIGSLSFNDVTVGLQLEIESGLPSIRTLQSNDDVILNSATSNIDIERIRFNGDDITSLERGGTITSITIATPLTRLDGGNYLTPANVSIQFALPKTGGGYGSNRATGTPIITGGKLSGITIVSGGEGYAKYSGPGLLNGQVLCDIFVVDSTPGSPDTREIRDITTTGVDVSATDILPTVFTLASTGIGYVRFTSDNALIIPAGTNAQRPASSEVGNTRWNTDNPTDNYLECFDGTTWNIATGAGGTISAVENYDLANAYILILG